MGLTLGGSTIGLGTTWIELQASAAALRRVFFFIDLPAENTGRGLRRLPAIKQGIAIESVDFRYPEGRNVLQGIDLDLRLGELIAIVGPTGAGKTSLAYLLPAYLRPSHGRVLVDGHDLAEVDVDSLREQVAYVFQEHLLLSESIRANLQLVRPQASDAQLRAALETACALDFVEALPNGLDTILGRAGDTLSVGQKQRLCIARGVLRETPILILDEPTAALDPQTESALMRSLLAARKGRLARHARPLAITSSSVWTSSYGPAKHGISNGLSGARPRPTTSWPCVPASAANSTTTTGAIGTSRHQSPPHCWRAGALITSHTRSGRL